MLSNSQKNLSVCFLLAATSGNITLIAVYSRVRLCFAKNISPKLPVPKDFSIIVKYLPSW